MENILINISANTLEIKKLFSNTLIQRIENITSVRTRNGLEFLLKHNDLTFALQYSLISGVSVNGGAYLAPTSFLDLLGQLLTIIVIEPAESDEGFVGVTQAELYAAIAAIPNNGASIVTVTDYSALPAPETVTGKFYFTSSSQGDKWLSGDSGGSFYSKGLYYSNGTTWTFAEIPHEATQTDTNSGLVDDMFITPLTLKNYVKWSTLQLKLVGNGFVKVSGSTISYDSSTYLTSISSTDITAALGFTPYSSTNPSGFIKRVISTISANTIASAGVMTDYVYTALNTLTIYLPTFVGNTNRYTIKSGLVATTTLVAEGLEKIDGTTTIEIAPEDSVDLVSNGVEWVVV